MSALVILGGVLFIVLYGTGKRAEHRRWMAAIENERAASVQNESTSGLSGEPK